MPQPFQIAIQDVAGGLNQSANKASLAANQLSECVNFYPWGKTLRKRPGRGKVNATAGRRVTGLFARKMSDGDWTLLVGQPDSMARLSAGALTTIPVVDGRVYVDDDSEPWRFRQYVDTVYAVRRRTGPMKAIRPGDYMADAGIREPGAAPILTQGVNGGNLDAGAYLGVYTYVNSATGAESNPSPASNAVGIAAGKMIEWSGIVAPPTQGVDTIRLYRTPAGSAQYFLVADIPYPGTLTKTDDAVETSNLGDSVSLRNGLPPTRSHLIEVFAERVWVSDGVEVARSEQGQPESFFGTSVLQVAPDDGHDIRALHAWNDRLIIGKTNALYYLDGTSDSTFEVRRLTDRAGVISPDCMRSVENMLFWYDGADVFSLNGSKVESIGDELVQETLESVATSQREFATAALYPRLSQYRLSVAANGATEHNTELVYNYASNAWTIFEYDGAAPHVYGDFYASDYEQLVYAGIGSDGYVYDLNSGASDDGAPILGRLKSRYFQVAGQQGSVGLQLTLRRLFLHTKRTTAPTTIELFLDSDADPYVTRTVDLSDTKDWRPRALSNLRRKATAIAFSIEHSGVDAFEVYGAVLHGTAHERTGRVR